MSLLPCFPYFHCNDGLKFYEEAILKEYGETEEFPRTGKRGRPKKSKLVPAKDLRYAQVIKNKKGGGLQLTFRRCPYNFHNFSYYRFYLKPFWLLKHIFLKYPTIFDHSDLQTRTFSDWLKPAQNLR
jgi:hypothetical protein